MMMIYVSRSFPAEVGERRDKDTREKFQRSLRTTQHTQQTRAFTLVVRSHRFGSSSLIFYLNSTTNSTIIYTYSFSDERFSLSCDLSLNRRKSFRSFQNNQPRFAFHETLRYYRWWCKRAFSDVLCLKKNERNTREREKKQESEKKKKFDTLNKKMVSRFLCREFCFDQRLFGKIFTYLSFYPVS